MITPTHRMRIEGVPAWEYAAYWGCGNSGDGVLFYNCSDADRYGRSCPNTEWTADEWRTFLAAVVRQREVVERKVRTREGRKCTGWTKKDVESLRKLEAWVGYQANTLETRSNWR